MPRLRPGCLLISSPALGDPNFMRSVVYLLEHGPTGSLGLIINRPLDLDLSDLWEDCPSELGGLHLAAEGGPVDRQRGLLLHGYLDLPGSYRVQPGLAVGGDPEAIQAQWQGAQDRRGPRLFLGHAGWQPGQLAEELREGSWFVRAGHPDLLLDIRPPDELWAELAAAGDEPPEPSEN